MSCLPHLHCPSLLRESPGPSDLEGMTDTVEALGFEVSSVCAAQFQSWLTSSSLPCLQRDWSPPTSMEALSHSEEEAGSSPWWKWPQNGSFCVPFWDSASPKSRAGPTSLLYYSGRNSEEQGVLFIPGPRTPLDSRWPLKTQDVTAVWEKVVFGGLRKNCWITWNWDWDWDHSLS